MSDYDSEWLDADPEAGGTYNYSSPGCGAIIMIPIIIAILFCLTTLNDYLSSKKDAGPTTETTSSSVEGSEDTYKKAVVKTSSQPLSMREQPSSTATVICGIPKGTTVTVLEQQEDWWYVEYDGKKGWCSAKYLSME